MTGIREFETGRCVEQGCESGPRFPVDDHEVAGREVKVDPAQNLDLSGGSGERADQPDERDGRDRGLDDWFNGWFNDWFYDRLDDWFNHWFDDRHVDRIRDRESSRGGDRTGR
jgi:hypothetical protein